MKRLLLLFLAAFALTVPAVTAPRPKLVVGVVVDQFRYDYLTRFRENYHAGLARLLEHGAVFTDAHHIHVPTVTAIGHSTFLTGATPALSGIVGNEWYDRASSTRVTSVSDPSCQLLGGPPGREGSSPHRLLVSTVGDELKISGKGGKVIGISIKDRAAILPSGHMADGAYWFDGATGNWVSSTFYFKELPQWVKDYNQQRPAEKYLNAEWRPIGASAAAKPFAKMASQPGAPFYNSLEATPFGNDLIEEMVEQAVKAEQLGHHDGTDLLTVSYSSNDYVGHALGPDAPQVRDISIRTDQVLGKLFDFLDSQIGAGNYVVVMTADHGVAPVPEVNQARKMPGGRLSHDEVFMPIEHALEAKYGEGKWFAAESGLEIYLNYKLISEKKLDEREVEQTAADAARAVPHILRVYTRNQLIHGDMPEDMIGRAMVAGFEEQRAGDLFLLAEPYWILEAGPGTGHGTPYNYDSHVPVIFMGPGIKPGRYNTFTAVNDIAPTLAAMLEIETPSGSQGRVLTEMLQ